MQHEYLNPPGLFHHPTTRVSHGGEAVEADLHRRANAGDDNYQPLHPGDLRAQYAAVARRAHALQVPFPAGLRDAMGRGEPPHVSPSTLIGVTALANPGFLIEVEIMAVVAA
jgi:hypothetical protein